MKVIIAKSIANGTRYGASLTIGKLCLICGMTIYTRGFYRNSAGVIGFCGPFGFVWAY